MGSLRTFHIAFVLIVFVVTDLFGAWAVYEYRAAGSTMTLLFAILSFAIGYAAVGYLIWMLRKFDKDHIQ